jgi:ApaG protein
MPVSDSHPVRVVVVPLFQPLLSAIEERSFIWSYTVTIHNASPFAVQLSRRHWRIVEASGFQYEVSGSGVIGSHPIIRPGNSFEYTSQVRLWCESGVMFGKYTMLNIDLAETFDVAIPAFSLDILDIQEQIN